MRFFILSTLIAIAASTYAQTESNGSLLSKLYFPFDFGSSFNSNSDIESGNLIKTGLEYRLNDTSGLYFRFNVDSRSNGYEITPNNTTNVIEGKLAFNDYVIGIGYRLGKGRIRTFALCQGGMSRYEYPTVEGSEQNYLVIDKSETIPIIKAIAGLEYYIAPNAALVLEAGHYFHMESSVFWEGSNLNTTVVSFGLTTTLF